MKLLYYKFGKQGVVTDYQAWLYKMTEFNDSFQEGLWKLKCRKYNNIELEGLEYEPVATISNDFLAPTEDQLDRLEGETNDVKRGYMEWSVQWDMLVHTILWRDRRLSEGFLHVYIYELTPWLRRDQWSFYPSLSRCGMNIRNTIF